MMEIRGVKETLRNLVTQLPDDATWDDVIKKVRSYQAIERAEKSAFKSWGLDYNSLINAYLIMGGKMRELKEEGVSNQISQGRVDSPDYRARLFYY